MSNALSQATRGDDRRWLVLGVLVASQFMVVLDIAIVNVALPSIRTDLHFSQESLQWVITAYSILFGGALLLGGRLADLLGRRRLFIIGVALFAVSSLLAGLAWSEGSLIAFRALQGLDVAGAATITSGFMLLVHAMTRATQYGCSDPLTIGFLGASVVLTLAFVAIELRSHAPLLPMRIFRLRTLSAANATSLLVASAVFSQFFLLTLYMQEVLHYSAIKTGLAYITLTVSIIGFSAVAQGMATRIGVRRVLPIGLLLTAAALVLYARLPV